MYRKVWRIVANHVFGKQRHNKPIEFIHVAYEDITFPLKLEYTHTVQ